MNAGEWVWLGLLGGGVAWELFAFLSRHPEWTLTYATQRLFRVHTPAGRVIWPVVWGAAALLFGVHISGGL